MRKTKTEPVKLGKDYSPTKEKRKASMQSEHTIEVTINASQLLAQLYALDVIKDSEQLVSVSFQNSVLGKDIKDNSTVGIPLILKVKKQEKLTLTNGNGTNR